MRRGKPFQPISTTCLPSDKLPASLSSIYVSRKPSPITSGYIRTRLEVFGPEYRNLIFGGGNSYNILANKRVVLDKACYFFYMGIGN